MTEYKPHEIEVAVIGGGQAGLSASYYLKKHRISHIVFERGQAMEAWRAQRWDNFCLVTPNWQCQLPGHAYEGADPDGFMRKSEIIEYLEKFREKLDPPLREGVEVTRVAPRAQGGFEIVTSEGRFAARQVIVASGGYREPIIPRFAERLPAGIFQIQSADYRNAAQLPEGEVLVVGSGQSGAQIAEDLHLAGKRVHLAVGNAPRCARFYRGRDVVAWLADMGYYEMSVEEHPLREGVRDNTNHYVTGRDGGRDIDLRKFAAEGMQLYGALEGFVDGALRFKPGLTEALDAADATYNSINAAIDKFIVTQKIEAPPPSTYQPVWHPQVEPEALEVGRLAAIIWCIGFKPDFGWLDAPVFNGAGRPAHQRGVTAQPGLYFLGLPWLHTWGSGRFSGVARDAAFIVQQIVTARATA
nr:MSMEG_0569 family flavin-dependent oxidoreductase [uncultured Acidocella sp.]